jgi:hypothetical protein
MSLTYEGKRNAHPSTQKVRNFQQWPSETTSHFSIINLHKKQYPKLAYQQQQQ